MKILLVNTVCTGASTATISVQLARMADAKGGDSLLVFGRGNAVPGIKSMRIENRGEFLRHVLFARLTDRQGFFSASATRRLCDLIRQYDPDIIHLHNLHGYYLNIEILFHMLAKWDKPIVMTLHDCWTLTGHCVYAGDCPKWQENCGHCPKTRDYPSAIIDQSTRNLDDKKRLFTLLKNLTVVTPSDWLAGLVTQSYLNKYPVRVIPNGIDLTVFKPIESDFKVRYGITGPMALGVANFRDKKKGLNDFVALAKAVPECRVVLVGLSKKQIRSLPESIIGLSRVNDPKQLAKIYSAADVFINPTYADNFPTVNLEALACGTPIVAYDTGGSAESIGDTDAVGTDAVGCGIAIPTGDREALIKAVRTILSNPPTRDQCVSRAGVYDNKKRFEEYFGLYETLAKGGTSV